MEKQLPFFIAFGLDIQRSLSIHFLFHSVPQKNTYGGNVVAQKHRGSWFKNVVVQKHRGSKTSWFVVQKHRGSKTSWFVVQKRRGSKTSWFNNFA